MCQHDQDIANIKKQVDAIADRHWHNEEKLDNLTEMVKDIHLATYGNGEPERGLKYRMAWTERHITTLDRHVKMTLAMVAANTLLALIIGLALVVHLATL